MNLSPDLRNLILQVLSESFFQVTVFVAFTLFFLYSSEKKFGFEIGLLLSRSSFFQPFWCSLLGAFPGCGGAIIVVTQYARGYVTFGSLVAVLIATMGDAAFFLLALDPMACVVIILLGIFVGSLTGRLIDMVHGTSFMRNPIVVVELHNKEIRSIPLKFSVFSTIFWRSFLHFLWVGVILFGFFWGILLQFRVEVDTIFSPFMNQERLDFLGAFCAIFLLFMWLFSRVGNTMHSMPCSLSGSSYTLIERVSIDTNFVTSWVIGGFLLYEVGIYAFDMSIESWLSGQKLFLPFLAVLIGFLPSCGPQIVVTSLYLNGLLPFSAQLGNAIANDGDALFPAIALVPRAAFLATIYSGIPAFILSYAYYFLFE